MPTSCTMNQLGVLVDGSGHGWWLVMMRTITPTTGTLSFPPVSIYASTENKGTQVDPVNGTSTTLHRGRSILQSFAWSGHRDRTVLLLRSKECYLVLAHNVKPGGIGDSGLVTTGAFRLVQTVPLSVSLGRARALSSAVMTMMGLWL